MTDPSTHSCVVIASETMGKGDDELGRQLMAKFVLQLSQQSPKPHVIVFYNSGVKLLTAGSPCLEGFRTLEHEGVELLACGTCIDFFKLRPEIVVGRMTDMREIVATINAAVKVATI